MGWWKSNGITAAKMAEVCRGREVAEVVRDIAPAFLLSFSASSMVRPGKTLIGLSSSDPAATVQSLLRFLPLRREPTSMNPFIGIGRLDGNDVSIADPTVSKFHAFMIEHGDAAYTIVDAASANGTWVERKRVPLRGGEPILLSSGDSIRFGSVTTTFLVAEEALVFLWDNFPLE